MKLSVIEQFEIRAHAFHAMTGTMAPGKDIAAATNSTHSEAYRREMWDLWCEKYSGCVRAMLAAFEAIMPDKD